MRIKSKFWLEDDSGEPIFGEGRRKILELIEELGSMQATAKALNMSYRGVWARIKATEGRLNLKLIETSVGRGKDRGSRLTPEAKRLLSNFILLNEKGNDLSDKLFKEIFQGEAAPIAPVVPAVAVVGLPGSGLEDLVRRLVLIWTARGRKVGVIKTENQSDAVGSSLLEAGAGSVIVAAGSRLEIHLPPGEIPTPESVAANYSLGSDLVLVESRRGLHLPSIE
ncbi:MAG: LysR family transcriptional regulator, partial [Pseudomonadota bacterium]